MNFSPTPGSPESRPRWWWAGLRGLGQGPLPGTLPADLARGVALHRAIDAFAETHPAFRASRAACRRGGATPGAGRYLLGPSAGARLGGAWGRALAPYCAGVWQLAARRADLPAVGPSCAGADGARDWLGSYAGLEGIADVLARMGRQARQ